MTEPTQYALEFLPAAARRFRKLPHDVQKRVKDAIEALRGDPHPSGQALKVRTTDTWRIRVGDYRVTYLVDQEQKVVTIAWVGHRKDAYQDRS